MVKETTLQEFLEKNLDAETMSINPFREILRNFRKFRDDGNDEMASELAFQGFFSSFNENKIREAFIVKSSGSPTKEEIKEKITQYYCKGYFYNSAGYDETEQIFLNEREEVDVHIAYSPRGYLVTSFAL